MVNRVKVVTGYVDLGLTKRPSGEFSELGFKLLSAVPGSYCEYLEYGNVWSVEEFGSQHPAANPRAEDRFADDTEHLRSNLIQHMPIQMLERAHRFSSRQEVFVWLGYSIMKQGAFTGKPVLPQHAVDLVAKLEKYHFNDIPIPSIRPQDPVAPYGDNWQFVGSTVIAPNKFLPQMIRSYKANFREFVRKYKAMPLDLAIWPAVVANSGLPFRPYKAEYDATQLTNFPD